MIYTFLFRYFYMNIAPSGISLISYSFEKSLPLIFYFEFTFIFSFRCILMITDEVSYNLLMNQCLHIEYFRYRLFYENF